MPETFGYDEDGAVRGDELELVVGGARYTGWREVSVSRSVDTAAGSFKVSAVPTATEAWPIRPLQAVEVLIGGVPVLNGWVDSLRASSDSQGRSVEVSGRDRAADLVDSSAVVEPGEWRNLGLWDLARELAAPFGVDVLRDGTPAGEAPFGVFALNPGETAWTAIERAARMRGVLVFSNGTGDLVLEEAAHGSTLEAELREGEPGGNVFRSSLRWTLADRFRIYTVRGQAQGSDATFGAAVSEVEAEAQDLEIDRDRRLLVIAEGSVSTADAEDRAQWEAAVRRARSLVLEVEVPGWRQTPQGEPWPINRTVHVLIPSLSVSGTFLIRAVRFSRGTDAQAQSTITLAPLGALDPQPVIPAGESPFDGILAPEEFEDELEDL